MKLSHTVGWRCCWFCSASACAVLLLSGCGNGNPATVQVQGTITYRGKPLAKGEVQFSPANAAEGALRRIAIGEVDAQGVYSLSTFTKGDGVLPGEYTVTITLPKRKSGVEGGISVAPATPFVPALYSELDKTPLKASVPVDASGTLRLDFDLKDQ